MMKRILLALLKLAGFLVVLILVVYFAGPRMPFDKTISFDPAAIGNNVTAYLAAEEAKHADIIPGLEKQVVWANPETKNKTDYALVYIHGFSASAGELRPVPDLVAKALGANLYFTRLEGHGRTSPDAMGEATLKGWLNDYAEAIAIGGRIGRKIIIMSTSTGGSLTTWGLSQPDLSKDVAAAIFFSPNYGIRAKGEFLLRGPWAVQIAKLMLGARTGFVPESQLQAKLWTTSYPVESLIPMAQIVKLANDAPINSITVPALFIYSSDDTVVRPDRTKAMAARWPASHLAIDAGNVGGSNHVLAGDAVAPQMNEPAARDILNWLKSQKIQAE